MNASVAIRLSRCGKTFADGTRALEPLDLEIKGGETIVLLGPSGCGKTTTLRIIAGLEDPNPGGRVFFDDADVTAVPIERRQVGMVFQSYALFPNMTVEENVTYGLRVRRMAPAPRAARVDEMLAMVHIDELRRRRVDQLSGGQKQRVALARALAVQPRVLLMDEPLAALDAKLRDELRIEIHALLRRLGVTAVYVTHDQAEAMALGDRIVVMREGRVAQVGAAREIYRAPASRFVADFIGTMNMVTGVARDGYLEIAGGRLPWRSAQTGPVDAFFRPESVTLVDDDPDAPCGRVLTSFFLGDRTRVVVDGVGSATVIVDTADRRELFPGQSVRLRIDPDAVLTLER